MWRHVKYYESQDYNTPAVIFAAAAPVATVADATIVITAARLIIIVCQARYNP